jgi:hypothetical protein
LLDELEVASCGFLEVPFEKVAKRYEGNLSEVKVRIAALEPFASLGILKDTAASRV